MMYQERIGIIFGPSLACSALAVYSYTIYSHYSRWYLRDPFSSVLTWRQELTSYGGSVYSNVGMDSPSSPQQCLLPELGQAS